EHRVEVVPRCVGSRRIGTEAHDGTGVPQPAKGIGTAGALAADAFLHPAHVVRHVKGLDLGDDTHPAAALNIAVGHHLRVNETEASIAFAVLGDDAFEHVHEVTVRFIAYSMHRQLETGVIGL